VVTQGHMPKSIPALPNEMRSEGRKEPNWSGRKTRERVDGIAAHLLR